MLVRIWYHSSHVDNIEFIESKAKTDLELAQIERNFKLAIISKGKNTKQNKQQQGE